MTDAELGLTLKREADQVLFEDLHFGSRLKDAVRVRLATAWADGRGDQPTAEKRGVRRLFIRLWRVAAATVVAAALAISLWPRVAGEIGLGYYPPGVSLAPVAEARTEAGVAGAGTGAEAGAKKLALPDERLTGGPAPRGFTPDFQAVADPYPVSLGQAVTLSSDETWPGRHVWLYAAPAEDQRTIMYDRLLPRDAILIGRASIDAEGHWAFDWTVPDRLTHGDLSMPVAEGLGDDRQTYIHLVAVTDTGYLAARGLEVGPPRTISVGPEKLAVGSTMTVDGSGYTPGTRLRLDLSHDAPDGGTDLQVTIGWATAGPDGRFTFTYTIPERLNWPYADNKGRMVDHVLTVGASGTYTLLIVEHHANQGPGPLLIKKLNLQTTP